MCPSYFPQNKEFSSLFCLILMLSLLFPKHHSAITLNMTVTRGEKKMGTLIFFPRLATQTNKCTCTRAHTHTHTQSSEILNYLLLQKTRKFINVSNNPNLPTSIIMRYNISSIKVLFCWTTSYNKGAGGDKVQR